MSKFYLIFCWFSLIALKQDLSNHINDDQPDNMTVITYRDYNFRDTIFVDMSFYRKHFSCFILRKFSHDRDKN